MSNANNDENVGDYTDENNGDDDDDGDGVGADDIIIDNSRFYVCWCAYSP